MPDTDFDLGSSMEEAFNQISGGGGEDTGASPSPDETAAAPTAPRPTAADSPAQAAAPASPTPSNPWDTMPKSWKKDFESKWGTIDPDVRRNIHEREKQALDGIMQYKSAADKWAATMEPYKQWFDHYKIDPHDAFKRLATSHIILKYGRPEDRAKWAQQLVQDYGLADILKGAATDAQTGTAAQPQNNEDIWQIRQQLEAVQRDLYDRQIKDNMSAVEKFFADPANKYAAELQEDIQKLFEQGRASTLQEAYETAMWLNPSVRKKLMDEEIAAATRPTVKGPPNVKSSPVAPAPTEEVEDSIEETMRATLQRMQSR